MKAAIVALLLGLGALAGLGCSDDSEASELQACALMSGTPVTRFESAAECRTAARTAAHARFTAEQAERDRRYGTLE